MRSFDEKKLTIQPNIVLELIEPIFFISFLEYEICCLYRNVFTCSHTLTDLTLYIKCFNRSQLFTWSQLIQNSFLKLFPIQKSK